MKVRVSVTLDIDPEAWTASYGVEGSQAIREDVKTLCSIILYEKMKDLYLLKED